MASTQHNFTKVFLPRKSHLWSLVFQFIQNPHSKNMIDTKSLFQLARKWQKMAAMKRKRISFARTSSVPKSAVANKGYFVVYTADDLRFTIPLKYLSRNVFVELLRMSEEEFGLPSDGPIALPCDSNFLNYVISLVRGCIPEDLEKALLTALSTCHFSATSSLALERCHQQALIYSN